MELKIVIGSKEGKCFQKELKDDSANVFLDKKIGDKINGEAIGLTGFELQITGGSDKQGFPMRNDNHGTMRRKILTGSGVGFKKKLSKGIRLLKSVAGNTVHEGTAQVNLKVIKAGAKSLGIALGVEQEAAPEAKEEAPAKVKEETAPEEKKKE